MAARGAEELMGDWKKKAMRDLETKAEKVRCSAFVLLCGARPPWN